MLRREGFEAPEMGGVSEGGGDCGGFLIARINQLF